MKKYEERGFKLLGKKFKLRNFDKEEIDIKDLVTIKAERLEDECEEIPYLLQMFGAMTAKAKKLARLSDMKYDIYKARLDKKIRFRLSRVRGEGNKPLKVTENMIENEKIRNKKYIKLKKKRLNAEEKQDIVNAIYWSLQKKSDILLELMRQRQNQKKLSDLRTTK